ncbi:MAG: 2,3-bisphosphoglycerate-independent phosphoglycerate mutase [Desulfamplus sp.]|nr:2,3-bisphosphoglycerate-independent phosphoglycerate mutase [Desulfamplus sp.]
MKQDIEKNRVDALLILDGWGVNPVTTDNAVALAHTPFLDMLEQNYPNSRLLCSGRAVGLPDCVMGNSEVGHMNIGAGRTVFQDLVRINLAIEDKSFFAIPELVELMQTVKDKGSSIHLIGLLSDGGVHSHIDHLFALIDMAFESQIKNIFLHPILDGRDTPPQSGIQYLTRLEKYIENKNREAKNIENNMKIERERVAIATLCGRFYAMDRDTRWERVEKAYNLYTQGLVEQNLQCTNNNKIFFNPLEAIQDSYASGQTDEFVKPILITKEVSTVKNETGNTKDGTVKDGDAIIVFNFRSDRAREITRAFTDQNFTGFKRKVTPKLTGFLCMTQYDESFALPVIFKPVHLYNILGEVVSREGLTQLRIAETEKYAHVTYFFNGGDEKVFPFEERILIPSPREVRTYDEKPEMSARTVAQAACERIREGNLRLMILNFANMDMVGHTGNLDAAIKACSTVDACVKQVVEAVWASGGTAMVTADHGNAEQMRDKDGNPHTAHTLNPVKFILAGATYRNITLNNGVLGDIAPTILKVMDIQQPEEMSGKPLF